MGSRLEETKQAVNSAGLLDNLVRTALPEREPSFKPRERPKAEAEGGLSMPFYNPLNQPVDHSQIPSDYQYQNPQVGQFQKPTIAPLYRQESRGYQQNFPLQRNETNSTYFVRSFTKNEILFEKTQRSLFEIFRTVLEKDEKLASVFLIICTIGVFLLAAEIIKYGFDYATLSFTL